MVINYILLLKSWQGTLAMLGLRTKPGSMLRGSVGGGPVIFFHRVGLWSSKRNGKRVPRNHWLTVSCGWFEFRQAFHCVNHGLVEWSV